MSLFRLHADDLANPGHLFSVYYVILVHFLFFLGMRLVACFQALVSSILDGVFALGWSPENKGSLAFFLSAGTVCKLQLLTWRY
jgi:hypothetical protein